MDPITLPSSEASSKLSNADDKNIGIKFKALLLFIAFFFGTTIYFAYHFISMNQRANDEKKVTQQSMTPIQIPTSMVVQNIALSPTSIKIVSPITEWNTYTSPDGELSFKYPNDLQKGPSTSGLTIIGMSDNYSLGITERTNINNQTGDIRYNSEVEYLKELQSSYFVKTIRISGKSVLVYFDGINTFAMEYLSQNKKEILGINLSMSVTQPISKISELQKLFDQILSTVEF